MTCPKPTIGIQPSMSQQFQGWIESQETRSCWTPAMMEKASSHPLGRQVDCRLHIAPHMERSRLRGTMKIPGFEPMFRVCGHCGSVCNRNGTPLRGGQDIHRCAVCGDACFSGWTCLQVKSDSGLCSVTGEGLERRHRSASFTITTMQLAQFL